MSDAVNPELSGSLTIAVVGSREYPNMDLVQHFIRMLPPHVDIISGAARGVDSVAAATAREAGLDVTEFPADWDRWGKSAGFIRNNDLVASADFVVAFWDGKSRGTDHTINLAKKEQVPHFVFGPEADDIKDALRLCMEEASRRAYVR